MERLEAEGRLHYSRTGYVRQKKYIDESKGVPIQDVWEDIPSLSGSHTERLDYPTQKPLKLLERIIEASSQPGDVVLDPFCGCGTAIAAAHQLKRQWIGIDITHLSVALMRYRLQDMDPGIEIRVVGEPEDLGGARQLANDDRYQFQWWALSLIRAKPLGANKAGGKTGKKGADQGIDGIINFFDDGNTPKRVLVPVKSGKVSSRDIRDLVGTLDREKAQIGVFLTLEEPSGPMKKEAVSAGYYRSQGWGRDFPRMQILTVEQLLHGAQVEMPPQHGTFREAQRARAQEPNHLRLDL
jgi:site-specific DNA-methyltransferase (adenine-specific)